MKNKYQNNQNHFKKGKIRKWMVSLIGVSCLYPWMGFAQQITPSTTSPIQSSSSQTISPETAAEIESRFGGHAMPNIDPDLNEQPVFGKDYGVLSHPIPNTNMSSDSIPVMLFFRYDEPSAALMPAVEEWKKSLNSDVQFNSSIASSGTPYEVYSSRIFFALTLMGKENALRPEMMKDILNQKLNITSPGQLTNWLNNHNISVHDFQKALNSNEDISLSAADVATTNLYEVKVAPCIIIDGRFWVRPNLNMTPARFVKIADFVLNVVRQEKKAKQS